MANIDFDAETKNMILRLTVDGQVTIEDLERLQRETDIKAKQFNGKPFGILVDLRKMVVSSPEAAEKIKAHQAQLMKLGLRKSAEVVASASAMLQLNRVAKESGMLPMLRRFTDFQSARKWLAEP